MARRAARLSNGIMGTDDEVGTDATLPALGAGEVDGGDEMALGLAPTEVASERRCAMDDVHGALDGGAAGAEQGVTDEHPGRYVVGRELGAGGIGKVYVALDEHLGRKVALKELLAGDEPGGSGATGSRSPMVARFVNEARVTGQLEHPGIVPVYELGRRQDGTIYYAMRLVRGRTLQQELEHRDLRRRLELLPNFVELCQAVAYAHSRGVVHRDLKPDNVMLGDFGETVVLDWGLAKVRGKQDLQSKILARELEQLRHSSAVETVAGLPIGTPSYMPPEQALGMLDEIDERSDVYSLGAVLYQLLTGRPPFVGKTALEVIRRVVRDDPEPPQVREAECPPELSAIALRALAQNRAERYADAAELAKDVRAFLTGGLVGAHEYSAGALVRRWLRRHRRALLAGLVAVAVGVGIWSYRGYDLARREVEAKRLADDRRRQQVVTEVGRVLDEAVRGSLQPRWLDTLSFKLVRLADDSSRTVLEDRLIEALAHERESVRRLAARALGGLGSTRAVEALCLRLAEGAEPVEDVTIEVINALGVIGDARAELPVRDARWRSGQYSRLWSHTELAFRMIPLPPVPAGGLDADQWTDRGRAMVHKGDVEGGLAAYNRAIDRDPTLGRAYNNRAIVRKWLGDYEGALADYDKSIELKPDELRGVYNRAIVRRSLMDYEGALADHDRVVQSGKMGALGLRSRALTLRFMGDFDASMQDLESALELEPNDTRTWFSVASVRLWQRRYDDAIAAFDRSHAANPDYAATLEWRAITHQILGNDEAALADYQRALDLDPSRDLSRRGRASLRLSVGDREGAKEDLDRCIVARCPNAATRQGMRWAQRGIIYHATLGELERARADVRQAVRVTRNADDRIEYKLLELALDLRLGQSVTSETAVSGIPQRNPRLWHSRLVAVLRGGESYESLAAETVEDTRRCYLLLAEALRAELAGDRAGALRRYQASADVPRPVALPCVMSRVSAGALQGR